MKVRVTIGINSEKSLPKNINSIEQSIGIIHFYNHFAECKIGIK